eukprot:CAMPEP_0185845478 /NCGR_PEP_ID=MMETSP1354-20130828/1447_1 /TAXON_ID=708628 /ORGANISM="Erythrolobus madagascarensis, Strain CCMP3276" /LENGTH=391 /DNA_ID=CAMNT_0028545457 /DNA_START=71 /DNA_END=1246 /DNA_ORIENTATION=-
MRRKGFASVLKCAVGALCVAGLLSCSHAVVLPRNSIQEQEAAVEAQASAAEPIAASVLDEITAPDHVSQAQASLETDSVRHHIEVQNAAVEHAERENEAVEHVGEVRSNVEDAPAPASEQVNDLRADTIVTDPRPNGVPFRVEKEAGRWSSAIASGWHLAGVGQQQVAYGVQRALLSTMRVVSKVAEQQVQSVVNRLGYHSLDEFNKVQAHMGLGLGVGLVIASLLLPTLLVHSSLQCPPETCSENAQKLRTSARVDVTKRSSSVNEFDCLSPRSSCSDARPRSERSYPLADELLLMMNSRQNSVESPRHLNEIDCIAADMQPHQPGPLSGSVSRTTSSLALDMDNPRTPRPQPQRVIVRSMFSSSSLYDSPHSFYVRNASPPLHDMRLRT